MKSKEFNTDITLTQAEVETISKKLVAAGIDRKLVESVIIGRIASDDHDPCPKSCNCLYSPQCDKFFRVSGPSDIANLRKQILERKIDLKKIHPKAEKLFRG